MIVFVFLVLGFGMFLEFLKKILEFIIVESIEVIVVGFEPRRRRVVEFVVDELCGGSRRVRAIERRILFWA